MTLRETPGKFIPLAVCGVVATVAVAVVMTRHDTAAATSVAVTPEALVADAVVLPIEDGAVAAHAETPWSARGVGQLSYSGGITQVADEASLACGNQAASLAALLAEWDRASFAAPSTPSQYRVSGRHGYVTSGPGYNAMVSLIRVVLNDCRQGRDREATMEIAKARSLLAASGPRQESDTATAKR